MRQTLIPSYNFQALALAFQYCKTATQIFFNFILRSTWLQKFPLAFTHLSPLCRSMFASTCRVVPPHAILGLAALPRIILRHCHLLSRLGMYFSRAHSLSLSLTQLS